MMMEAGVSGTSYIQQLKLYVLKLQYHFCENVREKMEFIPICFYPGGTIRNEKKNSFRF